MRLLFITSNQLGDAILSTGVLAHYLCEYPGADVTVVCGKVPAPLFRAMPGIAEIIPVEKQKYATHWLEAFGHLFGRRWDLMVDLRLVALMKLLPAKRRVFGKEASRTKHRLEDFADLLDTPGHVPSPTIWLDREVVEKARTLIPDGGPVIGVGPVTGPLRKIWRPERYAAVLGALIAYSGIAPGARIAVFGAPNERERAEDVIKLLSSDHVIDLVGATDPLEAAAALGRCSLYLGADSGLMHLAAAMDIPTVGLFGEDGVPQVYRPWGAKTAYVHRRNPDLVADDKPSAMDSISVDEVLKVCETLLQRVGSSESDVAGPA